MQDFFEYFALRIIPEPNSGCWLWIASATPSGYGTLTRFGKSHYAHRCAYEAKHGDGSAQGLVCRHQCDTPACVNPDHILVGTTWDNVQDAKLRGRLNAPKGIEHHKAVLTEADVLQMRALAKDGWSLTQLKGLYGLTFNSISAAVKGQSWKHLPGAVSSLRKEVTCPPLTRGENSPSAILNESDVRAIRLRLRAGERGSDIARRYKVSQATISAIKKARIWSHLDGGER